MNNISTNFVETQSQVSELQEKLATIRASLRDAERSMLGQVNEIWEQREERKATLGLQYALITDGSDPYLVQIKGNVDLSAKTFNHKWVVDNYMDTEKTCNILAFVPDKIGEQIIKLELKRADAEEDAWPELSAKIMELVNSKVPAYVAQVEEEEEPEQEETPEEETPEGEADQAQEESQDSEAQEEETPEGEADQEPAGESQEGDTDQEQEKPNMPPLPVPPAAK